MAIGALCFHSHTYLPSTDHVFALAGRFLLTTDTQVERVSSSTELLAVSGLVFCESGAHKVKHESTVKHHAM